MSYPFYGKYRGIVTNAADPLGLGRVRAHVPDVMGDVESGWAMPCSPLAGDSVGLFVVPQKDSCVWIEFEQGDPDYPIWSGCFWNSASERKPLGPGAPDRQILLQTAGGNSLLLDDSPGGGITLTTAGGQKISISQSGITIDNGSGATISLSGLKVAVNGDALEVI